MWRCKFIIRFNTAGYFLTQEDFDNGRKIDPKNQVSEGEMGSLDDALAHSKGNYQGDMMLTPDQLKIVNGQGRALHPFVTYWPSNGTHVNIPYNINDTTFTTTELATIARAIEDYETNTCIRYYNILEWL